MAAATDTGGGGDVGGPPQAAGAQGGRSCKGCLFYSSLLKSQGRRPVCVGVGRSLKQVPSYMIGESEMEAMKDGRALTDFKYACVGYSVYLDNKDGQTEKHGKPAEVPFCVGIELLVDKRATDAVHAPAHAHNKEDGATHTQPLFTKPPHSVGQEFLGRFTRNAGLIASGVAKNLSRVGNYIKDNLDDIMYPYRRRPK